MVAVKFIEGKRQAKGQDNLRVLLREGNAFLCGRGGRRGELLNEEKRGQEEYGRLAEKD